MKFFSLLFFMSAGMGLMAAPELSITPASFNFGKYPANEEKKHIFTLKNTGDELLKIEKIRHTCGCSSAKAEKMELQPGESARLEAGIAPESIDGPFSKGIFIHSNAGTGKVRMVTLSGNSEGLITVLPQKNLYLGTLKPGTEFLQEFVLAAKQEAKFGPVVVSGNIALSVHLEPMDANKTRVKISGTVPDDSVLIKAAIQVPVSEPQNWKPIEIGIQATVKKQGRLVHGTVVKDISPESVANQLF